ncbi:MAG: glucose-6-phosphate isomerase [Flavobacteriales bacterium]|nr:glucose-6-phosphate isomerase [Flavobacteriales bacterium]
MLKPFHINEAAATSQLRILADQMMTTHTRDLFQSDAQRFDRFHLTTGGLTFDYSKQRINVEVVNGLVKLAEEADLKGAIESMFTGEKINFTEDRAVLHTALRGDTSKPLMHEGKNIMTDIQSVLDQMSVFSKNILSGEFVGFTGKRFRHVVNIGIGGSDLGPLMVCEALSGFSQGLQMHFVSNVDGADLANVLARVSADETLFIVVSKTFTTQETLANAVAAKNWLVQSLGNEAAVADHFAAVSTNIPAVEKFGISAMRTFGFWDWVGGRYSLWGAVGLSIMLSVGPDNFKDLLRGARYADDHFRNADFKQNIPVLMALLGIWNRNFLKMSSHAVLPYSNNLRRLPAYLQQADMESNGKSSGRDGMRVKHETGPTIWGEPGTNGQHAFYQLLHQGTDVIPVDFIAYISPLSRFTDHHKKLLANCLAQSEAMMNGRTADEVRAMLSKQGMNEKRIDEMVQHKVFEGNRPSNTLLFDELTPFSVGCLVSFYENKIFAQGVLWNLYSFDQWGVELGKELAMRILPAIEGGEVPPLDGSTSGLLQLILRG